MRDLIGLHLQRVEWDKDGFVARLYPFTRSRRSPAEEVSQPRVVTMDPRIEFFPQGTEDVVWLREAGSNGWIVITRDDRIRYNQLEKQAVIAARLRFFSITSSSLTGRKRRR